MKRIILTSAILGVALLGYADDYKILQMNTPSIRIGNRVCKKGNVFSSSSVIHWTKSKQAFKAKNLKTKKIKLFAEPEFRANNCNTIDFFLKNNRTSSRSGLDFEDMKEILSDTYYMIDTLSIESPAVPTTETQYFCISYIYNGQEHKERLSLSADGLIIVRSMFPKKLEEITVSVAYHKDGIAEDYPITDKMRIVFIPKRL